LLRRVNGEIVYVTSSFSTSFDDFGHIPKFSTQMDNQGFDFPLSYFTNGNEKLIVDSGKTFII